MNDEFVCPACGLKLREVRMERGVFWACDQCGLKSLSVELLRRTFTAASINPFWLRTISGAGRIGRNCPCCRHAMLEVVLSEDAGAPAVDVCRSCHFVWFDASEITTLKPREIPGTELSPEAREARALIEVQRIARVANGRTLDGEPVDVWWQQFIRFLGTWIR